MAEFVFKVVGTRYCLINNVLEMRETNPEWYLPSRDLIAKKKIEKQMYKYKYFKAPAELVYEPTNTYNPLAIQVFVNGVKMGYVPDELVEIMHKMIDYKLLLSSEVFIYGGDTKYIAKDGSVTTGETSVQYKVKIQYLDHVPGKTAAKAPAKVAAPVPVRTLAAEPVPTRTVVTEPVFIPQPIGPQQINVDVHLGPKRNKWVAFFLCFFLGFFGVHKFYDRKIGKGILYLFTFGIFGIGWFVDLIKILGRPNPYYINPFV